MIAKIVANRKLRTYTFLYWKDKEHYYTENKDRYRSIAAETIGEACKKMVKHINRLKNPESHVIDYEVLLPNGDYSDISRIPIVEPYLY